MCKFVSLTLAIALFRLGLGALFFAPKSLFMLGVDQCLVADPKVVDAKSQMVEKAGISQCSEGVDVGSVCSCLLELSDMCCGAWGDLMEAAMKIAIID
jgi:hypothetical protein